MNKQGNIPRRGPVPEFSDLEIVALSLAVDRPIHVYQKLCENNKRHVCRKLTVSQYMITLREILSVESSMH